MSRKLVLLVVMAALTALMVVMMNAGSVGASPTKQCDTLEDTVGEAQDGPEQEKLKGFRGQGDDNSGEAIAETLYERGDCAPPGPDPDPGEN